jgi:hypothetical protein
MIAAALPSPPPIGSNWTPFDRPAQYLIAEGFDEATGRRWRLSVRPGMVEGQYGGLMFQRWGPGISALAEGQPHFYTKREDALLSGKAWIESGR